MKGLFAPTASALLLLLFSATAAPSQQRDLQLTASVVKQQSCAVSESVGAEAEMHESVERFNAGKKSPAHRRRERECARALA
jgi:hypothetical protein